MNICICFIGLQRTITQTAVKLKESLIDPTKNTVILFVTWENEDTTEFERLFPEAHVLKVPSIDIHFPYFHHWKQNLQMHISWRRTYNDNDQALFRYFLQIYLWYHVYEKMKQLPLFDVVVRVRTDIEIKGEPLKNFYNLVKINKKNYIYFPTEPRQFIDKEGEGCPDQLFFGDPTAVFKCFCILENVPKYKYTYIESKTMWYTTPTLEENIIQPESTLYRYILGEGLIPVFLPLTVQVIR